jgi:hypothetical protein
MKTVILSITTILLGFQVYCQHDCEPGDTSVLTMGNSTIIFIQRDSTDENYIKEKPGDKETLLKLSIDIGMNGYMSEKNEISLPSRQNLMELDYARSWTFGFGMMFNKAAIIKDRLYISPGLGMTWNNYFFKNNIDISTSSDSTSFTQNTNIDYGKYKLRVTYLQVPLIVGVRMGDLNMPFGIQAGVIGSYKIGSAVKEKYTIDDTKYKAKVKDDFNINPFKLEAIARVSIGGVGLFARYSLTTLFEENKAPELYPFSAGITVGGF